jgi:hypothetical protein
MRNLLSEKIFAGLLVFLSLSCDVCFANGDPYYLETALKKSDEFWNGYHILYLEGTSGTQVLGGKKYERWYELTYDWDDILMENIKKIMLMPSGSKKYSGYSDIKIFKKKNDSGELEVYLIFNKPEYNEEATLVLIPVIKTKFSIKYPSRMKYDEIRKDLTFMDGFEPNKHPTGMTEYIDFLDAFDLTGDRKPDIIVLTDTVSYRRKYVLGRFGKGWRILDIEPPL